MLSPGSSADPISTRPDLEALARALCGASPEVVVWKGARDLTSCGDLDCAAPRASWPMVEPAFRDWAAAAGLEVTLACTHAIGVRVLVACAPAAGTPLAQVDLVDRELVHGAPVWEAVTLAAHAVVDDGVRHLLPGAEGIARVLARRDDTDGHGLVDGDPAGAAPLAAALGARGRLARSPRARGVVLELALAGRALGSPRSVVRALATDRARRACPVLRALAAGRLVPDPPEEWLARVQAGHEVARA